MPNGHDNLVASLGQTERDIVQARLDLAVGRLENTARVADLRKKYARISTQLRAAEIAGGLPKGALTGRAKMAKTGDAAPAAGGEEVKGGFLKGIVDRLSGGSE